MGVPIKIVKDGPNRVYVYFLSPDNVRTPANEIIAEIETSENAAKAVKILKVLFDSDDGGRASNNFQLLLNEIAKAVYDAQK